ncbi:YigZ family protein [Aerococcus suis]|uniref:Uncharacterized protein, YigZ family n=1 Tax=Aerococcus suis TaxID=371602 RepID=A0A1W1Z6D7_9LACT|nr:YigZ family protein [Aerococcus suis]MCI7240013.1 YigZ family protein [Aerococcus suis]MDD7758602.1 YigZ family protein [Aerococcus suis]MDY4646722.1 YigZ family protein [Aerococcus suis]SMC44009.1 uncharacterized protein, YigZ family [Aerococcus suis]
MITYKTITEGGGSHEIEIKGSRFIGHIARAFSEEEAKAFVDTIKKEHWKATHNCVAFQIGDRNEIQRALDDGEPSGTAGVPMLEVLKQNDLHNVVVVVTRYFGGTKLGAGGLVRAYSSAVSEVMHEVGVVERQVQTAVDVTVDYSLSGMMENWLENSTYQLQDTTYMENVTYHLGVPTAQVDQLKSEIIDLTSDQASFEVGEETYVDVPVNPDNH